MPDLLRRFLQGLLMGGADIIPGVSGGTMALIVGIYKDLIAAIGDAFSAVLTLARGRFSEAVRRVRALNWALLLPVAGGIFTAIGIGSLFIPELLEAYPVQCRALFFGLGGGLARDPVARAARAPDGAHRSSGRGRGDRLRSGRPAP